MYRIAEIISDSNIGGAGRLLVERLKFSDRQKFKTVVILPEKSMLIAPLNQIGIETVEIAGCKDRSLHWGALPELCRILKELRPDLVSCHGCLTARIASCLCLIPRRFCTRHCAYPLSDVQNNPLVRMATGAVQQILSDHFIAVADAAAENLKGMGVSSHKITTVINGVSGLLRLSEVKRTEIRRELGIPDTATVLSICGRLEPCKGHKTFLDAAKSLVEAGEECYFLVIGDGSLRDDLKKRSEERSLSARVRWIGFVEDVTPYLNITDILVNCSVGTETSSLALSEGMSLGIPCIVSDYGGNPHMVRHSENGFVFPRENHGHLVAYVCYLMKNKREYDRMSQCAYQRFLGEFRAELMTEQVEALYEAALSSRRTKIKREEFG